MRRFSLAFSEPICVVMLFYIFITMSCTHSGKSKTFKLLAIERWLKPSKVFFEVNFFTDRALAFLLAYLKARSSRKHPIGVPSNFSNSRCSGLRNILRVIFALRILLSNRIQSEDTVIGLNSSGL